MKIGWIGLGKCGLPISNELEKIAEIIKYDIAFPKTKIESLVNAQIIFVLVGTPHKKHLDGSIPVEGDPCDFDYDQIKSVLHSMSELNIKVPIIIHSTLNLGISRKLALQFNTLQIYYMPIMIHIGKEAETYLQAPFYFIGCNNRDRIPKIINDWFNILDKKYFIGTYEEVETYKLMGNLWCSIKIAFANTLQNISSKINNINAHKVMEILQQDTVRFLSPMYLSPGLGDGGPCHPRDAIAMSYVVNKLGFEKNLFDFFAKYREWQAKELASFLIGFNLPISIVETNFKPETELTDGSYCLLIKSYCKDAIEGLPSNQNPYTYFLPHNTPDHYKKIKFNKNSVIVTPWNFDLEVNKCKFIKYGVT